MDNERDGGDRPWLVGGIRWYLKPLNRNSTSWLGSYRVLQRTAKYNLTAKP